MFLAIHPVSLRVSSECSVSCWYWVLMYSVVSWSISLLSCVNPYCRCMIGCVICSDDGVYGGVFVCVVFMMMSAILSSQ